MRLIDADKIFRRVKESTASKGVKCLAEVLVATAPTVDAVVVTRRKDCRSCRELNRKDRVEDAYAEGVLWCMNQSNGVWPDDFCSYGERREV
mgnify:CR=1 FL=1